MTARDPRTGRFTASTSNTSESAEGKFSTYTDLDVTAGPDAPMELRPRYAPQADELAQGASYGSPRLRARNPTLVHPDDDGHHNAVLRTAARSAGPMGPHAVPNRSRAPCRPV